MGDDASERTATADEIARDAGARPRRDARRRDRLHVVAARAARRARRSRGAVEPRRPRRAGRAGSASSPSSAGARSSSSPAASSTATTTRTATLILAMARASGRPVHLNTLASMPHAPDGWSRSLEFAEAAAEDGLALHPMFATNRVGVHFSLGSTFLFDEMPTFRDALTLPAPERTERLRDPAVRDRLRAEIADPTGRSFVFVWDVLRVETRRAPAQRAVARPVGRRDRRGHRTRIRSMRSSTSRSTRTSRPSSSSPRPPDAARKAATERMIRSPVTMAGSSDGGAHLLSFCGADYTTRLLTEWVPDVLTLEAGRGAAHVDPGAGHGDHRPRNAHRRAWRPTSCVIDRESLDARYGPLRARLPGRLRAVRRRRDRLPRRHRQRRASARGRHLDRRDSGTGHAVRLIRPPPRPSACAWAGERRPWR